MTQPPTPGPTDPAGVPTCYRHSGREAHIRCQRCERPICPDCMRDASVGFQCPSCVAEGQKSTRSGLTRFGGRRSNDPRSTTLALIGLNVAVWVAVLVTGGSGSRLVDWLGLHVQGVCMAGGGQYYPHIDSAAVCGAAQGDWLPGAENGALWQLVTSGFLHVSPLHIGFNMLALYFIGPQLEQMLGRARFLALYLISLVCGSAVVVWAASDLQTTLGASGAIYGLFAALFVVARRIHADMRQLFALLAVNVVFTFTGANISWQGHLGGFIGGLLLTSVFVYAKGGPRRALLHALGSAAVLLLALGAIALRLLSA
ncbi:rhomboid family intramembrane serine protease [Nocardioides acrostichi]|uniref:rhomboid family intramembrane serine protease n=1 Tax=Nocardioides acrostichi TaxID=2784339 RepID=UPI001A9C4FC4|nr:rhomboid family intramembrane serine protease [Nocardioides acrostichi]